MYYLRPILVLLFMAFVYTSCTKEHSCEGCSYVPGNDGHVIFFVPYPQSINKPIYCDSLKMATVLVDGNLQLLIKPSSLAPDCSSSAGNAVTLSPGKHTWQLICEIGGLVAEGTVNVIPGECQVTTTR